MDCPRKNEFKSSSKVDRRRKLFVSGLPENVESEKTIEMLNIFGDCKVTFQHFPKGTARVEYLRAQDAAIAVSDLNGIELQEGAILQVQYQEAAAANKAQGIAKLINALNFASVNNNEIKASNLDSSSEWDLSVDGDSDDDKGKISIGPKNNKIKTSFNRAC